MQGETKANKHDEGKDGTIYTHVVIKEVETPGGTRHRRG